MTSSRRCGPHVPAVPSIPARTACRKAAALRGPSRHDHRAARRINSRGGRAAAQDQMLLLGRKTAIERVASFLRRLTQRAEAHGRAGSPVALPMTRAEIGDYLGLTLETVSRTLSQLRREGAIELDGISVVRITSAQTLDRLAGAA